LAPIKCSARGKERNSHRSVLWRSEKDFIATKPTENETKTKREEETRRKTKRFRDRGIWRRVGPFTCMVESNRHWGRIGG